MSRLNTAKAHRSLGASGIRTRSKTGMPLDKNGKVILSHVGDSEHLRRISNVSVNGSAHGETDSKTAIGRRVIEVRNMLTQSALTFVERYNRNKSTKVQSQF